MKKAVLWFLCILMCALFAVGCGSSKDEPTPEETTTAPDESLYGTWSEDYFESGFTFNSDGTGQDIFWELPFTYTTEGDLVVLTYDDEMWGTATYSYFLDGNTLTMQQKGSQDSYSYEKQ